MRLVILIMSVSTLYGCFSQPPPPSAFFYWNKNGETSDDVKRALLECGANNPFGDPNMFPYPRGKDREEWAKVELCMIKDGFSIKSLPNCSYFDGLEICKPENAHLIPKRDSSVRLKSLYCRDSLYSTYPACHPIFMPVDNSDK